jgi:hypothetical protein
MPQEINLQLPEPSFIKAWMLEDTTICDELIDYFENSKDVSPGAVLDGGKSIVLKDYKDSLDLKLMFHEDITQRYMKQLSNIFDEYVKYFYAIVAGAPVRIEAVNVQRYVPGGGFHGWHTERMNDSYPSRSRVVVYMTYLNDVTDAGETEFMYQNVKIQPRKGLTLLWPADWTHAHRGIASLSQTKYITTGWYQFYS